MVMVTFALAGVRRDPRIPLAAYCARTNYSGVRICSPLNWSHLFAVELEDDVMLVSAPAGIKGSI
jgi:hypothetical protein